MNNSKHAVLIILANLEGGGAERVFVNIANEFVASGLQTEILLGNRKGVYFDILDPKIPVFELKATSLFDYVKKLPVFFRTHQYSHIFTASDYISVATVIAKKRLKLSAQIIATLHYNLPYQLSILSQQHRVWIKFINRHFIAKADRVIAVSHGVASGFSKIVGKKRSSNLGVIYNPVFDDSIYSKAEEQIPENLFEQGKITIINIGRLEPQKNHALLIEAFGKLTEKQQNMQLIIIGIGSLETALRKQILDANLEKHIHLLGFKKNPFAYLSKSSLFVLSSNYEGLPTVLIESLALGINVVSTNCPSGPDEILANGKFGWLAENRNPTSLVQNIEAAFKNKHNSDFLNGRAMQFHKKNIIPQYLNLTD